MYLNSTNSERDEGPFLVLDEVVQVDRIKLCLIVHFTFTACPRRDHQCAGLLIVWKESNVQSTCGPIRVISFIFCFSFSQILLVIPRPPSVVSMCVIHFMAPVINFLSQNQPTFYPILSRSCCKYSWVMTKHEMWFACGDL